ncbi:uncharacterized protein LAESUDRAFT_680684 [Laetiporus sulphureus 93-53]|uniref:F-box domain-containing protein n=1 Tax=Laetiporus sulphureus 93-53 TaxID=1314785 RepID=A0A165E092_9APHY|nr:uncharacterized protein LAESUDRAFT_680684 [Laetiporus sulphureus 93-53]KZT05998.1 hypothetical protein LAESUDRAFT_680684 [Laetiporus sulphureus 93-53]
MPVQTDGIFSLPTELIIHILACLDYKSILRCRTVCHLFDDLVKTAALLQYKVDLAVAGMEDGPPSIESPAERLQLLKKHQEAWRSLNFKDDKIIPMLKGEVWELYGGVLAQARSSNTLSFRQLPSIMRGIEEKEWVVEAMGFEIRDFTMDPSQDLLVVIQKPSRDSESIHVHLRVLATGAFHPAAPHPATLSHSPQGDQYSYEIQVSLDFLGILFVCEDRVHHELVIWNWKTGAHQLWVTGRDIRSFAFLSERHVVLGLASLPMHEDEHEDEVETLNEPELRVIDILHVPAGQVELKDAPFICSFHYPRLLPLVIPLAFSIRSDPAPGWKPRNDLQVPFFTARDNRLLVMTFWVADLEQVHTIVLYALSSNLMSYVNSLEDASRLHLLWDQWGPDSSRIMKAPGRHSTVWVCYVFGTKFISSDRHNVLTVYDFNLLPAKRQVAKGYSESEAIIYPANESSRISGGDIFRYDVTSRLPYSTQTLKPPLAKGPGDFEAVMLSEDSLIMLTRTSSYGQDFRHRNYRILTF